MSLYGLLPCHITMEDPKLELQVIYSGVQEPDIPPAMGAGILNIISQMPRVFSEN